MLEWHQHNYTFELLHIVKLKISGWNSAAFVKAKFFAANLIKTYNWVHAICKFADMGILPFTYVVQFWTNYSCPKFPISGD